MQITVLCKVVDNFGDIGVCWRLCKRLKKINQNLQIHLVVSNLFSFKKIYSKVKNQTFQIVEQINIFDWNDYVFCHNEFSKNDGEKMQIILECFQCGRPNWMDKILFEEKLNRTVNIIMIDYLTAEKYAEDFHCLKSLTRSSKIQKVNFMPGFTKKTGGLIIDDEFQNPIKQDIKNPILIFTYEKNWNFLIESIEIIFCKKKVLIANGKGQSSFCESLKKFSSLKNEYKKLDYINCDEWDNLMNSCSFLFVRGEESLSRACLSGLPFVWHAYPQTQDYQQIKVLALLDRLKNHFKDEDFKIINNIWISFNSPENEIDKNQLKNDLCVFFKNNGFSYGFFNFALSLRKNGDLGFNLMTFIDKTIIL